MLLDILCILEQTFEVIQKIMLISHFMFFWCEQWWIIVLQNLKERNYDKAPTSSRCFVLNLIAWSILISLKISICKYSQRIQKSILLLCLVFNISYLVGAQLNIYWVLYNMNRSLRWLSWNSHVDRSLVHFGCSNGSKFSIFSKT